MHSSVCTFHHKHLKNKQPESMEAKKSVLCFPDSPGWRKESLTRGSNNDDKNGQLRALRGSPLCNSKAQRRRRD